MGSPFPPPVERWLATVSRDALPGTTARVEGPCRFRRGGRGPWLPIEARMHHRLGFDHVVDLRIGLGPLTLIRGFDGYVDGTGFSRIGSTLDMGPEIDQASALFMWSEALLFPSAWRERDDVGWESVDSSSAIVHLPVGAGSEPATIEFDPASGLPRRLAADRYKGTGKPKVGWVLDYIAWGPTRDGIRLPVEVTVAWADEPAPWFRMRIQRANPGADVSEAMERAKALLSSAGATATS